MKKVILFIFILFIFSNCVFADQRPYWKEFSVKSPNGKYIAQIKFSDPSMINKLFRNFTITVKSITSGSKLWSCRYYHDGYPGGGLSDDGAVFININNLYDEVLPTVVSIYYKGEKIHRKKGTDFNIDRTKLIETVSHHYFWLDRSGTDESVALKKVKQETLVLEIHTIDKKTHWINVKTGKFIPQPSQ